MKHANNIACLNIRFVAAVAGGLLLTGCGSGSEAPQRSGETEAVQIVSEEIVLQREGERVEAVGTARARQGATIYPETSGEVTAINFEAGDYVAQGAVLARLENSEERLALASADVALEEARQLLSRYERIDVPGAVSESQIDAARTAVQAAEIDRNLAAERLAKRVVRAPFAGFVGIPEIDAGARIGPEDPITQLDDRSTLFVDFEAPEQVFSEVAEGDELNLIPFSSEQENVPATIVAVGSRIDPQRRLFTIRTLVENEDDRLRPGMSFRIGFDIAGATYPVVPEAAIIWGGDGSYVWAIRDGKAERTPVTIVNRLEGRVLVDGPLAEGDRIVAEGVQKVREGTPVELRSTGPAAARAGEAGAQP